MKPKQILLSVIFGLTAVFLIIAYQKTQTVIKEKESFVHEMKEYVAVLSFKERLLNAKEWIVQDWEWARKEKASLAHLEKAKTHYNNIFNESFALVYFAIGFVLLCLLLYFKYSIKWAIGYGLLIVSFSFLGIGIYTPMMDIQVYSENLEIPLYVEGAEVIQYAEDEAHLDAIPFVDKLWGKVKDVIADKKIDISKEFHGKMYYFYNNKSVVDLITILFDAKNYLVAYAILLFSIGIPVLKMTLSILVLLFRNWSAWKFTRKVVKAIGKWSMADVFVVAVFLSYLSIKNMNPGVETDATTLIGLYFFFSYVVVSMIASYFVDAAVKEMEKVEELTIS
ncbi:MAG: paraquat-inducible protein A [Crocinitomicaceae bacterium]|nr:paraquat-inducible protein A [Crocinitomicaceae bacterium]